MYQSHTHHIGDIHKFYYPLQNNGPQFTSEEFSVANGYPLILIPPCTEWLVQTIKQAVRALHQMEVSLEHTLSAFLLRMLLHYFCHNSGFTQFSWNICTRLNLLMPDLAGRGQEHQKRYHDKHSRLPTLELNQPVWVKMAHNKWRDMSRKNWGLISGRVTLTIFMLVMISLLRS